MKVRRYFVDAETGERYEAGSTFKGTPERIAELQLNGLLERPKPTKEGEQNDDSGNASGGKRIQR